MYAHSGFANLYWLAIGGGLQALKWEGWRFWQRRWEGDSPPLPFWIRHCIDAELERSATASAYAHKPHGSIATSKT